MKLGMGLAIGSKLGELRNCQAPFVHWIVFIQLSRLLFSMVLTPRQPPFPFEGSIMIIALPMIACMMSYRSVTRMWMICCNSHWADDRLSDRYSGGGLSSKPARHFSSQKQRSTENGEKRLVFTIELQFSSFFDLQVPWEVWASWRISRGRRPGSRGWWFVKTCTTHGSSGPTGQTHGARELCVKLFSRTWWFRIYFI